MSVMARFPWACGSGLSKARFAGFFHPSLAGEWAVPRLQERSIDVALLGRQGVGPEGGGWTRCPALCGSPLAWLSSSPQGCLACQPPLA